MVDVDPTIDMVRDDVMARLNAAALPGGMIGGVKVYRGQITDGKLVPTDDAGNMVPYLCAVFGGRGKVSARQSGIAGVAQDLQRFVFGIEVYGMNGPEVDTFSDRVVYLMRGFQPRNAGEIDAINAGRIENPAEVMRNHSREGIGLMFECYVGTITPSMV